MHLPSRGLCFGCLLALFVVSFVVPAPAEPPATAEQSHWCAPELRRLGENVCFHSTGGTPRSIPKARRTLVIFLHGLTSVEPGAAWALQRRLRNAAEAYGFSAMIPRGRPGLGPGRDRGVLGWPTARELQERHEAELLAEWRGARERAAHVSGPFGRVLLFGFSNGAYYAESLAFRESLPIDGVALFAGGSGSKYQRLLATRAKRRTPLFLGYGTKDPDHGRQEQLLAMLRQIDWPHRSLAASAGHTVSDAQLRAALTFLGHLPAAGEPRR